MASTASVWQSGGTQVDHLADAAVSRADGRPAPWPGQASGAGFLPVTCHIFGAL